MERVATALMGQMRTTNYPFVEKTSPHSRWQNRCSGIIDEYGPRLELMGPRENETRCHGYFRLGSAVLADQDQSGSAICHIKNNRVATPSVDWLHSDSEKFPHGLVEILDAQLRADFGRSKFKAELSSARVNVS